MISSVGDEYSATPEKAGGATQAFGLPGRVRDWAAESLAVVFWMFLVNSLPGRPCQLDVKDKSWENSLKYYLSD
jgi:hypothetical protein